MESFRKTMMRDLVRYVQGVRAENLIDMGDGSAVVLLDFASDRGSFIRVRTGDLLETLDVGGKVYAVNLHTDQSLAAEGFSPVNIG